MGIVWCRQKDTSGEATRTVGSKGSVTYKQLWQVLTDDMNDGMITVMGAMGLPQPYSLYYFGNEADVSAVATSVSPKRDKNKPLIWNVTITYTQLPGIEAAAGGAGDDPIDVTRYLPECRIWHVAYDEVVATARKGLPSEDFATVMLKDKTAVQNSAKMPLETPLMDQKYYQVIEITNNQWTYRQWLAKAYRDRVNSDTWWGNLPGTAKLVAYGGQMRFTENDEGVPSVYWSVRHEIHVKDDGWDHEVLDHGKYRLSRSDGTIPSDPSVATGVAPITDELGRMVDVAVPLDGLGQPLEMNATPPVSEYYFHWHVKDQVTFSGLQLPDYSIMGVEIA